MFSGIGGFREGLTRAGGFACVGHCEIDKYANRSYNALFDTKGEWFVDDARKADPKTMPDFQLLCGGFPCQAFSIAGARRGFGDPRGTLFFEIARLVEARHPAYLLLENVPGLLSHDGGRTFATILNALDRLGYGVEWQCLDSADFGIPQSRKRLFLVGYLDERCRGKVFPILQTARTSGVQRREQPHNVGLPIKSATSTGYQWAELGDSIDLAYATVNTRRGRVGKKIAHTLTTGCQQGTLDFDPVRGEPRLRHLTPREYLRLQGWTDNRIDTVLAIQSDNQAYKQAGNGVTVNVVEAIGRRIAAMDAELRGEPLAP